MGAFDKLLNSKFIDSYGAGLLPSFDFVDSSAGAEADLKAAPADVSAAVRQVIDAEGHKLAGENEDGTRFAVITKKTWLSWEIATGIEITPTPQGGSHLRIQMANMPGRPTALMDGKKNRKQAQKLADQIAAVL